MNYSIAKKIQSLNLECDNSLCYASDALLRKCYNGVGNEALPVEIRRILTKLTAFFTDYPFIIHDYDFQFLPKTKRNFNLANKRLKNNLKIILNSKLPKPLNKPKWYNFYALYKRYKRKFYLIQIRIIYDAVQQFGWRSFTQNTS